MGRMVAMLGIAVGLMMPAAAIAGEARAAMQVGITITGKDPHLHAATKPARDGG